MAGVFAPLVEEVRWGEPLRMEFGTVVPLLRIAVYGNGARDALHGVIEPVAVTVIPQGRRPVIVAAS